MSKRLSDTLSAYNLPPSKRLSRSSSPAPVEGRHSEGHVVSAPTTERCRVSQPRFRPPTTSSASTPANPSVVQHTDPAVSDPSACSSDYPNLETTATDNVKRKCFRISNIPSDWSADILLAVLKVIDPSLENQNYQLSLYPACCNATQTALLNLDIYTGYFHEIQSSRSYYQQISDRISLVIDSHFYGLTQLNIPEGDIVADVIAVTGLAGHAFGSWKSRETQEMWLKDFLPKDIKNVRIMIYGYDSSIIGPERNHATLTDYRRSFIEQLGNSRNSIKSRPIIFVGHSLGGILILQTLIESRRNPHQASILDSTYGLFFFGTPHQGLRTDELAAVVDADSGEMRHLIAQLKVDSEFLENQREELVPIFDRLKERKVVSFYETMETPSVRMLGSGEVRRDGPMVQMVQRFSAQLYSLFECRVPVNKNHTDMVKFASEVDLTYQTVVKYMKECIEAHTLAILWSEIKSVTPNQFLQMLLAADHDQERYKSTIPPFDNSQPKFYWILKNMDYDHWRSSDRSQVLWLCGPPECRIRDVSSHIVDLVEKDSEAQHAVIYFFCSAAVGLRSVAPIFAQALLRQIINRFPPQKQMEANSAFLRTLVDKISEKRPGTNPELPFRAGDHLSKKISKILDVSGSEIWDALKAVLRFERRQAIFLIIDGLDKIRHQKDEFIRELLAFIRHLQETFCTVKALLTSRPQADIKVILGRLPCIEYDKERKKCLNTLRFDNTRYSNIEEAHQGSLEWLWKHEKYKSWSSANDSDLLLIEGKPGSGKSTLVKYFKCNLLKREPLARKAIVGDFFYSSREGKLQTNHSNMLRSILYDVLNQNEGFFYHFQSYYRRSLQSGAPFRWPYDSLKKILLSFGNHPVEERLFLNVDAMDESDDEDRREIVRLLGQLCSIKKACIVKIFLASRPISELNRQTLKNHKTIKLQDVNGPDISKFAGDFLGSDLEFSPEIRNHATEYIVKNAQGVFIWVRLVKEELLKFAERGYSKKKIFSFLTSLPTELEEFYERILDNLVKRKEPDIRDGVKMFRLVMFACRPLRLEELQQTLAISDDLDAEFSPSDDLFDEECIQGIEKHIIYCGANFLEIKGVYGNSHVQVMHQTVREFFLRSGGPVAKSEFSMSHEDSHARISIVCIRYLMLCTANTALGTELPPIESWTSEILENYAQYLNQRPFISYIISHLALHITNSGDSQGILLQLRSQLSKQPANSPASHLLRNWAAFPVRTHSDKRFINRMLHTAARMQLSGVVETLLIASAEIEAIQHGKTPLMVSAEGGDEVTTRLLLSRGASMSARNNKEQTALHLAAINGHDSMVKLLIDRGADREAMDSERKTALHLAAAGGNDTTVQLLVETLEVDKEAMDSERKTALHLAAAGGNDTTVQLLVETLEVDKEAMDSERKTALHLAAESGNDTTVQLLVETLEVDKEAMDGERKTALHLATASGNDTTVRLLVETLEVDKEAMDGEMMTALHLAASRGDDTIVRLLVETLRVQKETKCGVLGFTALHWAVVNGHYTTVKLLVDTLGADKEASNGGGRTALHLAAEMGYDNIVWLLVVTLGVNKEARATQGQIALHLAAGMGHGTTVRLLVKTLGTQMETKCGLGFTALHWAVNNGHDTIVKLLIQTLGADKEARGGLGWTALHMAVYRRYDTIVRLVVETLGVDREARDTQGRTALHLAAEMGYDTTVQLLVETLGADKEARDSSGETALHLAAERGYDTIVQLLVETLGANREARNTEGRTALHLAALKGYHHTLWLLVMTLGADKGARDYFGNTAFFLAKRGKCDTAWILAES